VRFGSRARRADPSKSLPGSDRTFSRKAAKVAKAISNHFFARFASWREIFLFLEENRGKARPYPKPET